MNVEYAGMDFGSVQTRQQLKTPVSAGGWSAYVANFQGMDWLNPIGHLGLRAVGETGFTGWYRSAAMEGLRASWLAAPDLAAQQALARDIQRQAFADAAYYLVGQYLQPTAYRAGITGILNGFATFWNVRAAQLSSDGQPIPAKGSATMPALRSLGARPRIASVQRMWSQRSRGCVALGARPRRP